MLKLFFVAAVAAVVLWQLGAGLSYLIFFWAGFILGVLICSYENKYTKQSKTFKKIQELEGLGIKFSDQTKLEVMGMELPKDLPEKKQPKKKKYVIRDLTTDQPEKPKPVKKPSSYRNNNDWMLSPFGDGHPDDYGDQ